MILFVFCFYSCRIFTKVIPLFVKYCNTFCFRQYLLKYFVILHQILISILFVFYFVMMQNIYKGYSTVCKVLQYFLFLVILIAILCNIMQNIYKGYSTVWKVLQYFCFWQYILKYFVILHQILISILFVFYFVMMQNIYKGYSTVCKVLQYFLFLVILIAILCNITSNFDQFRVLLCNHAGIFARNIKMHAMYCNTLSFRNAYCNTLQYSIKY